jgi:hypothetical protein
MNRAEIGLGVIVFALPAMMMMSIEEKNLALEHKTEINTKSEDIQCSLLEAEMFAHMRHLIDANRFFFNEKKRFATSLKELSETGVYIGSFRSGYLLDKDFATGEYKGFKLTYLGHEEWWHLKVDPIDEDVRSFFVNQSGVIRHTGSYNNPLNKYVD